MARLGKMPRKPDNRRALNLNHIQLVKTEPMFPDRDLPLIVTPAVDGVNLESWAARHRDRIDSWLLVHGAILFRGFPVVTSRDFYQVVKAVSDKVLEYRERSSPREEVMSQIYTSTDYPKDQVIFLHNENSYQQSWPMKLFFFCETPPESRGETPIADCRRIFARLSPEIRDRFSERGIMYVRNFNQWSEVSWQTVFGTEDPSAVTAYCEKKGIRAIWKEKGVSLRTETVRPLAWQHSVTGQPTWFNHATFFHYTTLPEDVRRSMESNFTPDELPTNSYFGDGSPIDSASLAELRRLYEEEKILFKWKKGDVLLLDNMFTAHGREPFDGDRKILVAMAEEAGPVNHPS